MAPDRPFCVSADPEQVVIQYGTASVYKEIQRDKMVKLIGEAETTLLQAFTNYIHVMNRKEIMDWSYEPS